MTRYQKIAISLPVRAAENVRRAVRQGQAPSVSAYIAAAIEEKAGKESLRALLAELLEESGGPATRAERDAADRLLGFKPTRRRRRRRP
jgi:antitoxin ParD1/3/4